jgi:two-component system, OmpR family, phosphate regulon sensor histidine kinase PhoR
MNKIKKQGFLAIFTFLALVFLLGIQVRWLFKVAQLEEDNFNLIVKRALIEAREEIGNYASTCSDMKNYLCGKPCHKNVRQSKIAEIDSIISSKLNLYHINLDYTFSISNSDTLSRDQSNKLFGARCYLQSLNGLLEKDGIQIQLAFPERNQFIMAQLRGAFLLSFFAVIFVMISFFVTFKMFRREQQMVKQTSDFINNMVHEFQTPLSNIRLAANLISKKKNVLTNERAKEYLDVIHAENNKMERNVEEILKVSCIGKDNCELSVIDIHQVINSTVAEFKTRLESIEGIVTLQLDASKSHLKADANHFKLIISNLIDNAIKYSAGPTILTIKTLDKNNTLQISVKDNGIGIDKKDQSKIFEKYYRVSTGDVHNVKGFGLGLTYVKKLIETYKGKIEVSSTKGQGSEFILTLPLTNETSHE